MEPQGGGPDPLPDTPTEYIAIRYLPSMETKKSMKHSRTDTSMSAGTFPATGGHTNRMAWVASGRHNLLLFQGRTPSSMRWPQSSYRFRARAKLTKGNPHGRSRYALLCYAMLWCGMLWYQAKYDGPGGGGCLGVPGVLDQAGTPPRVG